VRNHDDPAETVYAHEHVEAPPEKVEVLGHAVGECQRLGTAGNLEYVEVRVELKTVGNKVLNVGPPAAIRARDDQRRRSIQNPRKLTLIFRLVAHRPSVVSPT
jgi:hypothetical protein